jgi:hypothetical protein
MAQPAMQSAKAQVDTRSFSAFRTATRLGGGVVLAAGFEERRQRSTSTRAATPSSIAVAVSAHGAGARISPRAELARAKT